jgi:hypothetical protein
MHDSVKTSLHIGMFPSMETALHSHTLHRTFVQFPLSKCNELHNFNSTVRLSATPYPEHDRPRGQSDLDSVAYHSQLIQTNCNVTPVWIAFNNGEYTLLDGAHRIVASHLENKQTVPSYVINNDNNNDNNDNNLIAGLPKIII